MLPAIYALVFSISSRPITNSTRWLAGNGHVGTDVANDDEWIDRVYKVLQENWPNPRNSYIAVF